MGALFEIFSRTFQILSQNILQMLKKILTCSYLGVFFKSRKPAVFGRKFKINRTATFRSVTNLVVECFTAYSETMFVTSPTDL